ncbi:hypothetical protein [Nocardia camponoti]|nr:hypothetical protein [Nocardia camponoti]
MEIGRTTVPGTGVLHTFGTRAGARFALLTKRSGDRHLLMYEADRDEPVVDLALAREEADQVADLMRIRSIDDRLAKLEREVRELRAAER